MAALLSKLSLLTLARVAGAFAMFLATLVITRHFGAEMTASYALVLAAAAIISVFATLGFHALAPVVVAADAAKSRSGVVRAFAATANRNVSVVSTVVAVAGIAAIWFLPKVIGPDRALLILAVIALVPPMALIHVNGGILSGLHRQVGAQLPDSLLRPMLVIGGLLALVVFQPNAALAWILVIVNFAAWLAAVVQFVRLRRALSADGPPPSAEERRKWWRKAPSWLTISLLWDYFIEVQLLVAALVAGSVEIAILHICFRFRVLAGFGMKSIYAVCQPKIYAADAVDDRDKVHRLIALTNALSLAYGAVTFVGLWILGGYLLALFDPSFASATPILLIVSATFLVRALFGPGMAILGMRGDQALVAMVLTCSLVVSVTGCLIFYPIYGLTAIAWAYTGANTASAAALWWLAKRRTGIDGALWAGLPLLARQVTSSASFAPTFDPRRALSRNT